MLCQRIRTEGDITLDDDGERMAILTLICPGCEKRTLIDDEDESSYCMHCGQRFEDVAVENAVPVEPVVESALKLSGAIGDESFEPADYSGEPWYPDVQRIESMLIEGDAEGAADELAKLLDANKDASTEIEKCMHDVVAGWLVDCIADGEAYAGGVADIARLIEEYGEDSGPNMLIASLFYALAQTPELIRVPEDAAIVAETLFNLLLDYPEVEPDIRVQLELCTDFMHVSGLLVDQADSMSGDDEEMNDIRDWIYSLQDFVRIFGDAIYDACDVVGDEAIDGLVQRWLEEDISTIGANVRDIADSYLDGEIDADKAKEQVAEYLQMYSS